jgi:hypothetical protein
MRADRPEFKELLRVVFQRLREIAVLFGQEPEIMGNVNRLRVAVDQGVNSRT